MKTDGFIRKLVHFQNKSLKLESDRLYGFEIYYYN